jgi:hypothetical protein
MGEHRSRRSGWQRWIECWFVAFALGGAWTVLVVPSSGLVASLFLFAISALVGVGVARDGGSTTSWTVVPVVAVVLTSLLGPLFEEPWLTLLVGAVMTATTPPVRARIVARQARLSVDLLSDWGLEARWDDSENELRRTDRADQALAVVLRRQEILDELVRRGRTPYE